MKYTKYIFKISIKIIIFLFFSIHLYATNYYFDAKKGNDKNTGTSPFHPFKSLNKTAALSVHPGDSILLKSGCIFFDTLYFSGKGTVQHPVVIGKYGGNKRPYIKGFATHLQMMYIYNSENIILRDIEVSNKGEKIRPYLSGVLVELHNYGIAKNIVLENLFVHDVYGSLIKGEGNNNKDAGGGQAIMIRNLKGSEHDSIPSAFAGLLVENCYIKNCQRNGIMMWGNWVRKYWFPNTKVVIKNNIIDGIPGDGIVPVGCDNPLIEYNVMKNCPAVLPPTEACDGIWPWSCDNAVIQYNIVCNHQSQVDGYGLDADYNCINSLFQYNLTYNNAGGFLLLCNSGGWPKNYSIGNKGTIVQYNISINDGIRNYMVHGQKKYFSPVIHITGNTQNSLIEKNLFIIYKKKNPHSDKRWVCSDAWGGYADSTFFINNYIKVEEKTKAVDSTKSTNNFYRQNYYEGDLITSGKGFIQQKNIFSEKKWYNANDENWNKLIDFIKDKTIVVNGKKEQVMKLIGLSN